MSVSPASVQSGSSIPAEGGRWAYLAVVVLIAVALAALGIAIGRSLDDGHRVGRVGVTTARTTAPVAALAQSDLGGAYHHRGGNQP